MKTREMNLTEGSLLSKLIIFSLPVIGVNVLQLLFNTADIVVVSWFVSEEKANAAVGAVGATTPIINLMIGLFIGLSMGANVVLSKCVGKGDAERAKRVVGSSVALSLVAGVILATLGALGAKWVLKLTNCKDELLDMATDYLTIYFIGMPVIMFYNFAAAILRAVGDTIRPFIFLLAGGIVNVIFNIVFVTVFNMTADGVAFATVLSNAVSAVCCFVTMLKSKGFCRFEFRNFRFHKSEVGEILNIGIPSGIQSMLFSVSNVIIQSSINSYGDVAVAGNSVAHTIDNYVYESTNGFSVAMLSFVSQNLGAGKLDRVKKSLLTSIGVISVVGATVGAIVLLVAHKLCFAVRPDEAVAEIALIRLYMLAPTYFVCSIMNAFGYTMRGMGKSISAMFISLFGACILRIIWIYAVERLFPGQIVWVYLSYPVTWLLTVIVYIVVITPLFKKMQKKFDDERVSAENSEELPVDNGDTRSA